MTNPHEPPAFVAESQQHLAPVAGVVAPGDHAGREQPVDHAHRRRGRHREQGRERVEVDLVVVVEHDERAELGHGDGALYGGQRARGDADQDAGGGQERRDELVGVPSRRGGTGIRDCWPAHVEPPPVMKPNAIVAYY